MSTYNTDSIVSSKTVRPGGRKKTSKKQPDYQQQMDGYSQLAGFDDNLPDY